METVYFIPSFARPATYCSCSSEIRPQEAREVNRSFHGLGRGRCCGASSEARAARSAMRFEGKPPGAKA